MGLAGTPPPAKRELRCSIMDTAVSKTRQYTGTSLVHLEDEHIRRMLDAQIPLAVAGVAGVEWEEWWEHDPAYGICRNTIARVDGAFEGSDRKFYAVLRDAFRPRYPGQKAVITVVDEADRKIAIRDNRWLEDRPDTPARGSLEQQELATIQDVAPPDLQARVQGPTAMEPEAECYVVEHKGTYKKEESFEVVQAVLRKMLVHTPFGEINVYRQVSMNLDVTLKTQ